MNQWVCLWWQVASGNFTPYVIDNLVDSISNENIDRLCHCIEQQTNDYICLNDPDQPVAFDLLAGRLTASFEKLLPEKSSFEW